MHNLLPIALRAVKDDNLVDLACELSTFFKQLYAKELDVEELHKLQNNMVLTSCHMDQVFPLGFLPLWYI